MPNYNDAQGVADLLSQFDFNIISEGPGDFSTQHRKYTCEFSKPGIESFTTTYQCNPRFDGQPTATDVFAALASDTLAVDGHHIDDFADELGFEKPSQAIRAYESCQKTLDWLKNGMQLTTSEISDIAETIDNELDEVKEEVERVQAERKAKHEFEHPPVPEGFTSIEDLQSNLDLGEYGDQITDYTGNIGDAFGEIADSEIDIYTHDLLKWLPDNYEWLEEADAQGLLEGCKGNLIKMTQMAQYECFTQDMYNHQEDIAKYAALDGLKEAGVYALADEVYDDVFDGITIDFNDNNMDIEDFATEAQTAIQDAMDSPLYDALGSNDEILEDGIVKLISRGCARNLRTTATMMGATRSIGTTTIPSRRTNWSRRSITGSQRAIPARKAISHRPCTIQSGRLRRASCTSPSSTTSTTRPMR